MQDTDKTRQDGSRFEGGVDEWQSNIRMVESAIIAKDSRFLGGW
jgi:hypothetical protein